MTSDPNTYYPYSADAIIEWFSPGRWGMWGERWQEDVMWQVELGDRPQHVEWHQWPPYPAREGQLDHQVGDGNRAMPADSVHA